MILYLDSSEGDAAALAAKAKAVLGALAEATKAAVASGARTEDLAFLWGVRGDDMMRRVLEFAKVTSEGGDGLIILNVPGQEVFYGTNAAAAGGGPAAVTAERAKEMLDSFTAGTLSATSLS